MAQIRAEQSKIDRNEGQIVASYVELGRLLLDMKNRAKRTWTQQVQQIGYHPRAASRLQQLAKGWWTAIIGTNGSDLFDRLPPDPQKLEWLCRLTREQMQKLLNESDPKRASRKEVIATVKAMLGKATTPRPKDPLEPIKRRFDGLVNCIRQLADDEIDEAVRAMAAESLADKLAELQAAMESIGPSPASTGGYSESVLAA
jgi:hypothetical protein